MSAQSDGPLDMQNAASNGHSTGNISLELPRAMNWPEAILSLVYVKQALSEVDVTHLWPHHLPSAAATDESIALAERRLGHEIDPGFRSFQCHANGWTGFFQTVDLFGADDLVGSSRFQSALDMVSALDEDLLRSLSIERSSLIPVAASALDRHLFAMMRSPNGTAGEVLWFDGGLVDRFPSFDEFFLAMVDYNREEIAYFKRAAH